MNLQGFRGAPVTRGLVYTLIAFSLAASIMDIKYLFHIQVLPHLLVWKQFWRMAIWQLCYANSGELLFATVLLYNLRVVERLFGSRKFASFTTYTLLATSILPPLLLALLLHPLTSGKLNYLPPGPTPLIFALLSQYHASIPSIYKIAFSSPSSSSTSNREPTTTTSSQDQDAPLATLTDKLPTYLLATQLALSHPPSSLFAASLGWIWGYAYRSEIVPGSRWRVPGWLFDRSGGEYEALRRRLASGEFAAGVAGNANEVADGQAGNGVGVGVGVGVSVGAGAGQAGVVVPPPGATAAETQNRPLRTQILDQFRGVF